MFVLGADNKVEMKQIKPGPKVDKLVIVEEGLKPEDKVVVEGQQKLRPGMQVRPVTSTHAQKGDSEKPES